MAETPSRRSEHLNVGGDHQFVGWAETSTMLAVHDLAAAVESVRRAMARRLGLAQTDLQVLEHLLMGAMGPGELGRRLGVTKSAVTGIANRLIRSGRVRRRGDAGDRRRTLLELTPSGRQEMVAFLDPVFSVLDALDHSVPPGELQAVGRYLRDATRAFEAVESLLSHSSPRTAQRQGRHRGTL